MKIGYGGSLESINIAHDDRYDEMHFLIINLIIPTYSSCSALFMMPVHRHLFIFTCDFILFL